MTQWIAFDQNSVDALTQSGRTEVQLGVGDALSVALETGAPAVALLPAGDKVSVITVHRSSASPTAPEKYIATGFLGLSDAPAGEDDERPAHPWWHFWK